MTTQLETWILLAGFGQLSVLVASAVVPFRLNWKSELMVLPTLHRQLYWIYGGYVALSIVSLGLLSVFNASELAAGGPLARGLCAYIALFWGIRLSLQGSLDVKDHLKVWWVHAGYHILTVLFLGFTVIFGYAAFRPE